MTVTHSFRLKIPRKAFVLIQAPPTIFFPVYSTTGAQYHEERKGALVYLVLFPCLTWVEQSLQLTALNFPC